MKALELLRESELQDALAELQKEVKADPANARHRVFLFQLLAVLGEWDRALTQLNVAGELDAGTLAMVQTYREAIRCEILRRRVFAGRRSPLIFGDPTEWLALLLEAVRLSAEGKLVEAQALRQQAFEQAPATTGHIDGEPFDWIADADSRLGPVLEAIVNGRYYWVPFHQINRIDIDAPEDLRDSVWMPAHFVWRNGGECVGLIPTRYPGSETSANPRVRLAKLTEWVEAGGEEYHGLGQRLLATNAGEYPLMDVRQVVLNAE